MRLALSNIAWDPPEDEKIVALLQRFGIDAIDVAPGKYFPDLNNVTDKDVANLKNWWVKRGVEITGMQALLFGTSGMNIFGSFESQRAMLLHLTAVCRIAAGLGAIRIVFGSPKNRDRSGLNDQEAMDMAISFFRRLGDIAQCYGVIICLEPNPTCYGANFMVTSAETAMVVKRVNHTAIKMQMDTGAIAINQEDPLTLLQDYSTLIGHIHASEPDLLPLGDGGADHSKVFNALEKYLPNHIVAIEMLATKNEPHEVSIERALTTTIHHYRNYEGGSKI